MKIFAFATALLFGPMMVSAQLIVTLSTPRISGQKILVPLALKNDFTEKIESARAVVFLLDEKGKMVGNTTRWVIGGQEKSGLAPGATNSFFFIIPTDKSIATTNLTAKLSFNRVILEGGKLADVTKDVTITTR